MITPTLFAGPVELDSFTTSLITSALLVIVVSIVAILLTNIKNTIKSFNMQKSIIEGNPNNLLHIVLFIFLPGTTLLFFIATVISASMTDGMYEGNSEILTRMTTLLFIFSVICGTMGIIIRNIANKN